MGPQIPRLLNSSFTLTRTRHFLLRGWVQAELPVEPLLVMKLKVRTSSSALQLDIRCYSSTGMLTRLVCALNLPPTEVLGRSHC